jgi:hypothetical protein
MGPLTNHDKSESGLSDTPPGHRAGSPSLLTLLGPDPKAAAGVIPVRVSTRKSPSPATDCLDDCATDPTPDSHSELEEVKCSESCF